MLDAFQILDRILLFSTVLSRVHQLFVHVDANVHKFPEHVDCIHLRDRVGQVRVHNVPELRRLCYIAPVLGEEPARDNKVVDIILLLDEGELLVEVENALALCRFSYHLFIVKIDLFTDRFKMLSIHVHAVTEALHSRLVRPELDVLEAEVTLSPEAELLCFVGAFDDRHTITASTRSHFFRLKFIYD